MYVTERTTTSEDVQDAILWYTRLTSYVQAMELFYVFLADEVQFNHVGDNVYSLDRLKLRGKYTRYWFLSVILRKLLSRSSKDAYYRILFLLKVPSLCASRIRIMSYMHATIGPGPLLWSPRSINELDNWAGCRRQVLDCVNLNLGIGRENSDSDYSPVGSATPIPVPYKWVPWFIRFPVMAVTSFQHAESYDIVEMHVKMISPQSWVSNLLFHYIRGRPS